MMCVGEIFRRVGTYPTAGARSSTPPGVACTGRGPPDGRCRRTRHGDARRRPPHHTIRTSPHTSRDTRPVTTGTGDPTISPAHTTG